MLYRKERKTFYIKNSTVIMMEWAIRSEKIGGFPRVVTLSFTNKFLYMWTVAVDDIVCSFLFMALAVNLEFNLTARCTFQKFIGIWSICFRQIFCNHIRGPRTFLVSFQFNYLAVQKNLLWRWNILLKYFGS